MDPLLLGLDQRKLRLAVMGKDSCKQIISAGLEEGDRFQKPLQSSRPNGQFVPLPATGSLNRNLAFTVLQRHQH